MCAYNRFDGDPCCGSDRLLMQILRDEWGCDGIVLSDCGACLLYTSVYHPFFLVTQRMKREVVYSPLDLKDGQYQIDFERFRKEDVYKRQLFAGILSAVRWRQGLSGRIPWQRRNKG